jgi:uncharacterized protein YndB with AHSA1/START domain
MDNITKLLGTTAAFLALVADVQALEVSRSRDIAAPPAAVWAIMEDFCAIELWHPQVARCTLSEDEETAGIAMPVRGLVTTEGLGPIVEAETARDGAAMTYSYILLGGPLPVKNYSSTIAVTARAQMSVVTWRATFDADGMSEADTVAEIEAMYERGLAGIAKEAAR